MLDARWVDSIHTRLLVRFGAAWVRMWEGIPEDAVKADWAQHLSGLAGWAIKHALENLPADRPPTVGQFRSLCLGAPIAAPVALPAPKADPERVAAELAKMQRSVVPGDGKDWAHRLREREKQGGRLTLFQREAWRFVLGSS